MLDQRRRGLQESTIGVRNSLLRHFSRWMGERGLLAATTDDIELFLDSRKVSARTRAGYLSSLRVFYSWATLTERIARDPSLPIIRPRVRPGLPRPINDSDLDLALRLSSGLLRVIIALGAYEGMRCIEIARLTREDVLDERDPPVVIARGKGDKPRPIPLHDKVWEALRLLPMPRSGAILSSPDGRPYQPWEISHIGNDFLHGLGIEATMHQLRHWFGTAIYRTSGKDLLLARDLMGHASVETTRIYAAYDRNGAVDAVSALEVRPSSPEEPQPGRNIAS